jgi:hypothetical protein
MIRDPIGSHIMRFCENSQNNLFPWDAVFRASDDVAMSDAPQH